MGGIFDRQWACHGEIFARSSVFGAPLYWNIFLRHCPQTDMLQIVYDKMNQNRHLLPFDPNLFIKLLHINVNHNYFEFASLIFQQIKGTAMGAAFSPTAANIFMSVTIRRFLHTQNKKPLLLVHYIDDIFMIWIHTEDELKKFLIDLNSHNSALSYTYHYSLSTVDFLDLTVYKSPRFAVTNILDTKTFQKPHNLYQYLHYTSNHQKSVHKAIISGELIRYVRTNMSERTRQRSTVKLWKPYLEYVWSHEATQKL